jgi:hypothetical protein
MQEHFTEFSTLSLFSSLEEDEPSATEAHEDDKVGRSVEDIE